LRGFLPQCKEAPTQHTGSSLQGGADAAIRQKDRKVVQFIFANSLIKENAFYAYV